ncbi:MAG: PilZ domain-containing protein [Planctomycetes bacterium]|nr:PilZ domain-containing protein [Planctomycetota bacterium]
METTEICPLTLEAVTDLLVGRDIHVPAAHERCRRRATRWPFPGPVELWIPESNGTEHYALATCLNLSLDGLGMLCDEQLPVGMELAIAIHQPEVSFHGRAVVRHATVHDDGYFIGLQFRFDEASHTA